MRVTLVLLLTATLALAAPRPQGDDDAIPTSEEPTDVMPTVTSLSASILPPLPTLPVDNTTLPELPPNTTMTEPPTTLITSSAELPTSTRSSRTRRPHTEPIPIFTSKCACRPMGPFPCYARQPYDKCLFEQIYSLACNMENGGCPYPTMNCKSLPAPTPITGRHPCDFGPPEEKTIISSMSSVESMPLTVTATPTVA